MQFFEAHFINKIYITSPTDSLVNAELLLATPRAEIADPVKLTSIVQGKREWFARNGFSCIRVPYQRTLTSFTPPVCEGDFFVMLQNTQLFETAQDLPEASEQEICNWLFRWWQTPFLITTSIYTSSDVRYAIPNGVYPHTRVILTEGEELDEMITGRCYTIANGLILALAMHRTGLLKNMAFVSAILTFLETYYHDELYQPVCPPWDHIYYFHPTQQIADFPRYYVCSGPCFADSRIIERFIRGIPGDHDHVLTPSTIAMTSYVTAMLPHYNNYIYTNYQRPLIEIPDMYGHLNASTCTSRRSWKQWVQWEQWTGYLDTVSRAIQLLAASFVLYKRGSDNGVLVRRRLTVVWRIILQHITFKNIPRHLWSEAPFNFVRICHEMHGLTETQVSILRSSDNVYYTKFMKKNVITRLILIYQIFGMTSMRNNTFQSSNIVGELVLDVFKKNKMLLFT